MKLPALLALLRRYLKAHPVHLAVFVAIAGIGGVTLEATVDGDPAQPAKVDVHLGGPGDSTVTVAPKAVDAAAKATADHAGSRDESPEGLSHAALSTRQNALEAFAMRDQLPLVAPDAAPSFPGCVSHFVRNFSSRGGVAPRLLVAHYTVSRNRPGWDDVNAIVALFDRSAFAASSNFVIDDEGNCAYIVRDTDKAWTQAAANPYSVSIEFVAMGDEGSLSRAALKKGGEVFAVEARRWGLSIARGAVAGCVPTRTGIVMHADLGACGGGHTDIRPFALEPLIAATKTAATVGATPTGRASLKAGEKANVDCLVTRRKFGRHPNRHGGSWAGHALRHRDALKCKAALSKSIAYYLAHPKPQASLRAARLKYLRAVVNG